MGTRGIERGMRPAGDRIEIRFTWQGKELRPTLNMRPSAANLKHAARVREPDQFRSSAAVDARDAHVGL